jgi:hypothetical protein
MEPQSKRNKFDSMMFEPGAASSFTKGQHRQAAPAQPKKQQQDIVNYLDPAPAAPAGVVGSNSTTAAQQRAAPADKQQQQQQPFQVQDAGKSPRQAAPAAAVGKQQQPMPVQAETQTPQQSNASSQAADGTGTGGDKSAVPDPAAGAAAQPSPKALGSSAVPFPAAANATAKQQGAVGPKQPAQAVPAQQLGSAQTSAPTQQPPDIPAAAGQQLSDGNSSAAGDKADMPAAGMKPQKLQRL